MGNLPRLLAAGLAGNASRMPEDGRRGKPLGNLPRLLAAGLAGNASHVPEDGRRG